MSSLAKQWMIRSFHLRSRRAEIAEIAEHSSVMYVKIIPNKILYRKE